MSVVWPLKAVKLPPLPLHRGQACINRALASLVPEEPGYRFMQKQHPAPKEQPPRKLSGKRTGTTMIGL